MVTSNTPDALDDAAQPRPILAVSVGNTRTKFGLVRSGTLEACNAVANTELDRLVKELTSEARDAGDAPIVLASVNDPAAKPLADALKAADAKVLRIGRDILIRLTHSLDDATTLGIDRQLNALAGFAIAKGACILIDCGTAVTIDFVDGEGVFHGGAIAPGAGMMLRALHEFTAALPLVEFAPPDPARGPFGKDTTHAMLQGAAASIRGMAHLLIDRYAEFYEAYPRVIATGGDAEALFSGDELIERIVPGLTLMGIQEACKAAIEDEDDE
jgi:type III pantothenate kinase